MAKGKLFKIAPEQARKLWVKALRSGKFKQTIGTLAETDGGQTRFCCLGIACDLFNQHEPGRALSHKQLKDGRFSWGRQSRILPETVRRWLGLNSNGGEYRIKEQWGNDFKSLAELNDDGVSFTCIADVVEHGPEGLIYDAG